MHVLVVEDDPSISQSLVESLEGAGFDVTHAPNGKTAIDAALAVVTPPEVILLDLGLPDMDGYDVCRAIRASSSVPIIVLTARGEELDRVLGLELGADDYVVKPFGFRELVARIRAVVRRYNQTPPAGHDGATDATERLVIGPLVVDRRAHRVLLEGDEIALTPKEFELLEFLAEDPGAVRSRTDIIERVWDANWFGPTKTVDAHVAGIRKKLGHPEWVEAVRGVGFRLEVPE
jgi:DNA-binding response OmpR family regulator